MIMEGLVFGPSGRVMKASSTLSETTPLEVRGRLPYVSRGGLKLAHALDTFGMAPEGMVGLDVGASTGGFTHCLLLHGALHVHAVDVGYGQLAWELRNDPRVTVLERTNIRYLQTDVLDAPVDLVVVDVSFISLEIVLGHACRFLAPAGRLLALIKPQFEAERSEVGRGGVIKDPKIHARVLARIIAWTAKNGFWLRNLCPSPILGDAGNREFFLHLEMPNRT